MLRGSGKIPVRQAISRPVKLGPEHNPWFWHPNRVGVRKAPTSFMERLKDIDPSLDVTWNPITERWQVWAPNPRFQHPICQGWRLLFVQQGPDREYLPLDERVFARLYWSSADAWGSAKKYFDHMQSVMREDQEKRAAKVTQEGFERAQEYLDYTKPRVGYGENNGSKFSRYL